MKSGYESPRRPKTKKQLNYENEMFRLIQDHSDLKTGNPDFDAFHEWVVDPSRGLETVYRDKVGRKIHGFGYRWGS